MLKITMKPPSTASAATELDMHSLARSKSPFAR
jgi:hypothetical protein